MAMHHLQAVQHVFRFERIDEIHELRCSQTKYTSVAACTVPVTADVDCGFNPHANDRFHLHGSAAFDDDGNFGGRFNDENTDETQFYCSEAQLDKFLVLVAVADN